MGEAFVEAYKADADRATVLLDPFTFGFEQAPAGQRLIVYTGRMPRRSVGGARRHCLLGGALGDAFGYAVEFDSLEAVRLRFGPEGIREPVLHAGRLVVSDDTQM